MNLSIFIQRYFFIDPITLNATNPQTFNKSQFEKNVINGIDRNIVLERTIYSKVEVKVLFENFLKIIFCT